MSIENRTLKLGMKLVARYKGKDHRAEGVKTADGLRYRLDDGREFRSPSSARRRDHGRPQACNGWKCWSIAEAASPKSKTSKARAKQAKPESPAAQIAEPANRRRGGTGTGLAGAPARQVPSGVCLLVRLPARATPMGTGCNFGTPQASRPLAADQALSNGVMMRSSTPVDEVSPKDIPIPNY